MPAEITTTMRPWYTARCTECDNLYLASGLHEEIVRLSSDAHDKLVHSDPPQPHGQPRIDYPASIVGGWRVECPCGYRTTLDTSDEIAAWKCPLDRSEAEQQ